MRIPIRRKGISDPSSLRRASRCTETTACIPRMTSMGWLLSGSSRTYCSRDGRAACRSQSRRCFLAATALTLVRSIIFGLIVGLVLLVVVAARPRISERRSGPRLAALATCLGIGIAVFAVVSPATARGVSERFLPGITAQSEAADLTAQYRQQALSFGYHRANARPFGSGLVPLGTSSDGLAEQGYLAHSAWTTLFVYTGWLGLAAFVGSALLLVRRSFRLPDASGWLKPFFAAGVVLLLVEGFGADSIVSQPWVLGEGASSSRFASASATCMSSPMPRSAAVVIPVHNGLEYTKRCLSALEIPTTTVS